jgi:hypothetical protein
MEDVGWGKERSAAKWERVSPWKWVRRGEERVEFQICIPFISNLGHSSYQRLKIHWTWQLGLKWVALGRNTWPNIQEAGPTIFFFNILILTSNTLYKKYSLCFSFIVISDKGFVPATSQKLLSERLYFGNGVEHNKQIKAKTNKYSEVENILLSQF